MAFIFSYTLHITNIIPPTYIIKLLNIFMKYLIYRHINDLLLAARQIQMTLLPLECQR